MRNWIAMSVMAYWIKRATAKQLITLGSEMLRLGTAELSGVDTSAFEVLLYQKSEAGSFSVEPAVEVERSQKWVA